MGISRSELMNRSVFVDYDFEEVMFRYDHKTKRYFRKFYGRKDEVEVWYDNRLLTDALLYGNEIDEQLYKIGKEPDK